MSSNMRETARAMGELEASINGFVRRMVKVPENLLGGFSRAMNQGIDLMEYEEEQTISTLWLYHVIMQRLHLIIFPKLPPTTSIKLPFSRFAELFASAASNDSRRIGFSCEFRAAIRYLASVFLRLPIWDALKMAEDEHKFVFMYIHSPEHPFTPYFCPETLCSEVVVQFLDANFVCWGGLASRGEGMQMAKALWACSFPFCAVVAPASGDNFGCSAIEGPVLPAELVEILQRTMEEQGLAFGSGSGRAKQVEILQRYASLTIHSYDCDTVLKEKNCC